MGKIKFKASRNEILKATKNEIKSLETGRTTSIGTDWSRRGMGLHLAQKYYKGEAKASDCCPSDWKTILADSRLTTEAESRYAPVEGEAWLAVAGWLAVTWLWHGPSRRPGTSP